MKTFTIKGYTYPELDEQAKENVQQWYLRKEWRTTEFYEDIIIYLKENFPNSFLKVCFSLSGCQGDGLNIYGELNLFDFLKIWNASEAAKKTMEQYLYKTNHCFAFENNHRYCYSCKFIDIKNIDNYVDDMYMTLEDAEILYPDTCLIRDFYTDMLNYFEELDSRFEKQGYDYLYNVDGDEITNFCEINEYYFTKDGILI